MNEKSSAVDTLLDKIKNNKLVAVIIVVGLIIIALGTFLEKLQRIAAILFPPKAVQVETGPTQLGKDKITFFTSAVLTNLSGYNPCFANKSDTIVYCSPYGLIEGGVDLMTSKDGGQSAELLVQSSKRLFSPRFSHNDRYIAFISTAENPAVIYNAKGELNILDNTSKQVFRVSPENLKVHFDLNYGQNFDWSPLENKLVYVAEDINQPGALAVYLYDHNKKTNTRIYSAEDGLSIYPQWSPDGSKIGFTVGGGGLHHLWLYNQNTGKVKQVEGLDFQSYFLWLSNTDIVFTFGGAGVYRIAKYDLSNKMLQYLTKYEYFTDPVVSPTKETLGFIGIIEINKTSYEFNYQIMNLKSQHAKTIFRIIDKEFYISLVTHFNHKGNKLIFAYDHDPKNYVKEIFIANYP